MSLYPIKSARPKLGFISGKSNPRTNVALFVAILVSAISAQAQTLRAGSLGQGGMGTTSAGIASAVAPISMIAVLPPSLGLSVSNVHLRMAVDDPNVPTNSVSVPVTSTWHLGPSSTAVELVAYFDSPQQALSDDQGHWIPSSRVKAGLSGTQPKAFTETSSEGSAGGSRILFREDISHQNYTGSRNDTIELSIDRIADLSAKAGVYEGTLRLRMTAY
ncbi:MAG TPA: hypothetical protein VJ731_03020 [Terriglobales bacterium]|nr:hypothetical protein [Terriglobales bacterium]